MSREKDQLTNTQDAGDFTESGNHAAGGPANDTTQVNRAPNIDADKTRVAKPGETNMTEQSIGGQGAQDGISGTPSGTQGGEAGQGINQGGKNQQSSQGQPDLQGGTPNHGGTGNLGQTKADPQEANRDRYGDQETGATSGEVGDGRSEQQVAVSGSQATQHSAGGSQQEDSDRAARSRQDAQHTSTQGGSGTLADHLQAGPGNKRPDANQQSDSSGLTQATPAQQPQAGPAESNGQSQGQSQQNGQPDQQRGMQGAPGDPGHDIADIGSKQSDEDDAQPDEGMLGTPGDPGHDIADIGHKQSDHGRTQGGSDDQR